MKVRKFKSVRKFKQKISSRFNFNSNPFFATQVWCTLTNLVLVYAAEQEQKFNIGALLVRLGGGWRLEAACNAAIVPRSWQARV